MENLQLQPHETFVTGSDTSRLTKGKYFRMQFMMVLVCHTGYARIEIDMEEVEIRPHDQLILLPECVLHMVEVSDDYSHTYLSFDREIIDELCNRIDPTFFRFLKEHPLFPLKEEYEKRLLALFDYIGDVYADTENIFREQIGRYGIQSFLLNLYDKTHRATAWNGQAGLTRPEEIFLRFIKLVRQHCFTQREVNFYAGELYITPRYLSTVAHDISGATAKQLIDKHVIIEIKIMLKTTQMTLQEIAHKMNFPDQSFFGRYFKKHTGLSPLQYRNKG